MMRDSLTPLQELKLSFVDALDAWELIENEAFMLWQMLQRKSESLAQAMEAFNHPHRYPAWIRDQIESRARKWNIPLEHRQRLSDVLESLVAAADKRNRLIHGKWAETEVRKLDGRSWIEHYRRHASANLDEMYPTTDAQVEALVGTERWYLADMKRQAEDFLDVARAILMIKNDLLGFLLPRFDGDGRV